MTRVRQSLDILRKSMDKKFKWRDALLTASFAKIRERVNKGLQDVLSIVATLVTRVEDLEGVVPNFPLTCHVEALEDVASRKATLPPMVAQPPMPPAPEIRFDWRSIPGDQRTEIV